MLPLVLTNRIEVIEPVGADNMIVSCIRGLPSGTWNIGTQGDKSVQFKVTDKNASSSGYVVAVDYIKLTPQ